MAEQHIAQPGESWAYRARSVDDLVEVVVVRLGSQRPARILVRFVVDHFEGRQEWVPPSRLKVRWEAADEFRECCASPRMTMMASSGLTRIGA
jgi:hypothetical protein